MPPTDPIGAGAHADADAEARRLALDPTRSFIVQAPAGSGKTTLLTQRYLSLLAHASRPEEILAITFTRKAAAEMRGRVLEALQKAAAGGEPANANEARTRPLALAALAQDARHGWQLLEEPGRLRMQTFDALNQWLAGRLPVLSGAGAAPAVNTEPRPLYEEAARRTVARLEEPGSLAAALGEVLGWLDNEVPRLVELIAAMLATRDHWLRHLAAEEFAASEAEVRSVLEGSLASVVTDGLAHALGAWPAGSRRAALAQLRVAAARVEDDGPWRALLDGVEDLSAQPGHLPLWLRVATLLLTGDSAWRRTVDKRQGFPSATAADKEAKAAMLAYLGTLAGEEPLRAALEALRALPPPAYEDGQWAALRAIVVVLGTAAAELEVVFAERGEVDFVAVSRAALHALGQEAEPSDFALRLDYRLRHLLVDEFQDTSAGQVALLERLTEGYTPGDGRTVFCVGDPMQSVYRFREADVALFLKVRDQGLGALALTPLVLERNFRSQPALVDWVNDTFGTVFPARDDLRVGAVRHARARAATAAGQAPGVHLHPLPGATPLEEGRAVAALVAGLRAAQPEASIAVLGRARAHLSPVARALTACGVPYQGLSLVKLKDRLAVRDLVSLTRAVCHLADRDAWLGCLRAPFTGVALADLHVLLAGDPRATVRERAGDPAVLAQLAADARERITRTVALIDAARADRGRRPLAACIESLWLALGAPATLTDAADLDNAAAFLDRLDVLEEGGDLVDPVALEEQLEELYAVPDPAASERLQLMTIHHAKGLEWDIVVLVGLGRGVAGDRARLLHWQSWERPDAGQALVLAPVRARSQADEAISAWVARLERTRAQHETQRVLYVATTRAINELHLVGAQPLAEDGAPKDPPAGSALALLAPAIGPAWAAAAARASVHGAPAEAAAGAGEQRLAAGFVVPAPQARLDVARFSAPRREQPEFVWVSEPARHAGTVVHEELARRARDPDGAADPTRWRRRLREHGLDGRDLDAALVRVRAALEALKRDARGRWILAREHSHASGELALSGIDAGEVVSVVIDRTFVDADGVRWIIDYKTSTHEGAGLDAFLDEEARRYREQLERYARLMRRYDPAHRIRLGLYFPLLGGWREWEPA